MDEEKGGKKTQPMSLHKSTGQKVNTQDLLFLDDWNLHQRLFFKMIFV